MPCPRRATQRGAIRVLAAAMAVAIGAGEIARAQAERGTQHAAVSLVAETQGAVPGEKLHVALREQIQPGWHTYWINPGDSGLPTTIDWQLPAGFAAGPIEWPTPERIATGPLVSYGYRGELLLPVAITIPEGLVPGSRVTLSGHAGWLACADVCVPEAADVTLTLPVTRGPADRDPRWGDKLQAARAAAPIPAPFAAAITVGPDTIELRIAERGGRHWRDVIFFPADAGIIDNDAEQHMAATRDGIILSLARGELKGNPLDRLDGVLAFRGEGSGSDIRHAVVIAAPIRTADQLKPQQEIRHDDAR